MPAGDAVAAGPCPDRNLLAGLADGDLLPEERAALEPHLSRCPACARATARAVALPDVAREAPPSVAPRWIAAAAILAAVGGLAAFINRVSPATPGGTDARLVQAAATLARARPDLFGGFAPYSREERRIPAPDPTRGASRDPWPRGRILDTRPEFRWEPVPGVERFGIGLCSGDGRVLWRGNAAGTRLPFPTELPSLEPGGRYILEVVADGPLGRTEARSGFAVAAVAEQRAFADALRAIDGHSPPDLAPLLRAHLALRRGLAGEAARFARAASAAAPEDPVARETLGQALDLAGIGARE